MSPFFRFNLQLEKIDAWNRKGHSELGIRVQRGHGTSCASQQGHDYYTFLTWPAKHSDGLGPNPFSGQQDGCAGNFWLDFRAKDAGRDHAPSRMRYFSRQSAVLRSPNVYYTFAVRSTE
jgi:hypothetical protein